MLPDTGERYMTTPLFADIGEQMTAEELALSRSTPGCRFDESPAPAPAAAAAHSELDFDTRRWVTELIRNEPVVLFALEWCEFCWSVRRLFAAAGIPHRTIALDSAEHRATDRGGRIREVLAAMTGASTIPQIFIGGEHVGGSTDLFRGWRAGSIQRRLVDNGIRYDADASVDPEDLLPKWLQPRCAT
jgi:cysteine synthase A